MNTAYLVKEYLAYQRVRNLAASTVDVYQRSLSTWVAAMPANATDITFSMLIHHFEQWEVRPKTKYNVISLVKELFSFAVAGRYLPSNPAAALPLPQVPQREPEWLTSEQVKEVLRVVRIVPRCQDGWYTHRNCAIVYFLVDTGCRISELCHLRRRDVDLAKELALIQHGKGGKPRWVYFSAETAAILQAHWTLQVTGEYCIENRDGAPVKPDKARRMFYRLSQKVGFKVRPHMLRHTCGTLMLDFGSNLRDVQELLGHADIRTTELYTHVDPQILGRRYKPCSVIKNLIG